MKNFFMQQGKYVDNMDLKGKAIVHFELAHMEPTIFPQFCVDLGKVALIEKVM